MSVVVAVAVDGPRRWLRLMEVFGRERGKRGLGEIMCIGTFVRCILAEDRVAWSGGIM